MCASQHTLYDLSVSFPSAVVITLSFFPFTNIGVVVYALFTKSSLGKKMLIIIIVCWAAVCALYVHRMANVLLLCIYKHFNYVLSQACLRMFAVRKCLYVNA